MIRFRFPGMDILSCGFNKSIPKNQINGFTLLEVVITLLIFALTAAGVAGALSSGLRIIYQSKDIELVRSILQQEMAYLRSLPPEELKVQDKGDLFTANELLEQVHGKGDLTIRNSQVPGLLDITLSVTWKDRSNQLMTMTTSSVVEQTP